MNGEKRVVIIRRNRLVFIIGYATGLATGLALSYFIIKMLEILL